MHDHDDLQFHRRGATEPSTRFHVEVVAAVPGGRLVVVEDAVGIRFGAAFLPDPPAVREAAPPAPLPSAPAVAPAAPVPAPVVVTAPASSTWRSLVAGAAIALAAAGGVVGAQHLAPSAAPAPMAVDGGAP
jgi:hypothetical protein